ncbi:MAG TPA: hypothetical protein VN437_00410 [Rectinemataceae bacterium]|nr:hypothetical protein [Rectinemataceae bacterium]
MKRKARYLAAGIASLAKPFLLGTIAVGIGLSDSGGFASSYLRYLIFPHLIPAVCFFFLYFDEEKYLSFKPLAGLFEVGSIILLATSLIPVIGNPQKIFLAAKSVQSLSRISAAYFSAILIDLFGAVVLISRLQSPGSKAAGTEKTGDGDPVLPKKEQ